MFVGRKSNQYWKFLTIILLGILLVTQIKADLAPNEDDEGTNEKIELEQKPSEDGSKAQAPKTNLGFIHAFIASFSVIIVSEIGDKTFFIAAIMSMKYPRLTVFGGAITALALMTVLSAVFGMVFIQFIPPSITRWVSVGLFVVFGLKMLHEGWKMTSTDAAEEMEEVQADIRKREDELNQSMLALERRNETEIILDAEPNMTNNILTNGIHAENKMLNKDTRSSQDAETGGVRKKASPFTLLFKIFMQAFTMTFVAEWGDRSQITTIILAARENLWGVILGGIIGHSICTGLGVLGGRIIAQKISVRTVTIVGGIVFLIFAITSSIWDPNDGLGSPAETSSNTGGN